MSKKNPAIVDAVLHGDAAKVRAALSNGFDINERDRDGRTGLHHSVLSGNEIITKLLLDEKANIDCQDNQGWTALHFAARDGNVKLVKMLLEAGARVDPEDIHGNTPLFRAVFESRGRGDIILLLRDHGADMRHKNKHGMSPFDLAESISNYDVARWLR